MLVNYDILYQNISGEMPTVRQSVEYRTTDPVTGKQDTLDEIAAYWGVDPKVIKDYNKLESDDISGRVRLSIPIKEILNNTLNNCLYRKIEIESDNLMNKYSIKKLPALLIVKENILIGKIEGYYSIEQKEEFIKKINEIIN